MGGVIPKRFVPGKPLTEYNPADLLIACRECLIQRSAANDVWLAQMWELEPHLPLVLAQDFWEHGARSGKESAVSCCLTALCSEPGYAGER